MASEQPESEPKLGSEPVLSLSGITGRIKDLPWGSLVSRLNPRQVKWKKLFGPFLLLLVAGLLVTYGLVLRSVRPTTRGKQISLSQLYGYSAAGQVREAEFLEQDAHILLKVAIMPPTPQVVVPPPPAPGEVVNPQPAPVVQPKIRDFFVKYPASDSVTNELTDKLITSGANVKFDHQNGKKTRRFLAQFLLPLLILASVFSLFFLVITGNAGGASDFLGFSTFASKVQRRKKGQKGEITFADVAGVEEGLVELREVVEYLMNPGQFAAMGAKPPKGVLLAGPPGTGKTLLARAMAGEAAVPFIQLSGSEFVESLVGVGAARVRDLFRQARELAPCIVFIDELDAAGRQRGAGVGGGNDEREQTLNQLLVEMDGFSASSGVVIVGASNRPDILDPALLRPGRFDRQVVIDVPDVRGRTEILKVHARGRPIDPEVNLEQIAKQVPGFTGAELANIMNEAAILAVRARRDIINQDDLERAVDRTLAGPERRSHLLTDEEKLIIAYHEAGHAVVATGAGQEIGVLKLSIVARGLQLGHATTYGAADRMVLLRSEVEQQLITLLGGLAAERLVFGEVSSGNAGDLEKATTLARKAVATWGMSDDLGRSQVLHEGQVFMGRDFSAAQHISPDSLNAVDSEIHNMLLEAEQQAVAICKRNRAVLDAVVEQLLVKETLMGDELWPVLDRVVRLEMPRPVEALVRRASNGGAPKSRKRTTSRG